VNSSSTAEFITSVPLHLIVSKLLVKYPHISPTVQAASGYRVYSKQLSLFSLFFSTWIYNG